MKILVLGKNGMLGSMVYRYLSGRYKVDGTTREQLNAETTDIKELMDITRGYDWVINCIGVIMHLIDESPGSKQKAILVNAIFPIRLGMTGVKIIQIETDCVYDGFDGDYTEDDLHNAVDIYGKTKSLGEFPFSNVIHLRNSIIGPGNEKALFDWFLNQKEATGFANHFWNGITTLHFAKLCEGIIKNDFETGFSQHIVPADWVTKYRLLKYINEIYGKNIKITLGYDQLKVNRILDTNNRDRNNLLWKMAGYKTPPTIREMVRELYKNTNISRS